MANERNVQSLSRGRVTLPAQAGMETETLELARKWGADSIRDSDGTKLSDEIMSMGYEIFSVLCLVRADQDYVKAHPEQLQQKYLVSGRRTAVSQRLSIDPLGGFFREEFKLNATPESVRLWEVFDRTTGEMLDRCEWEFDPATGNVVVLRAQPWHVYTVNFLAWQIWDETSMYNHLLNKWTGEHVMGLDPRHPQARAHMMDYLEKWLAQRPHCDMVRLTSLAYHFPNVLNEDAKPKFLDWLGYHNTISPLAMEQFEKDKGYRLRLEDLIDEGYYNSANRIPSKAYLDYLDFTNRFVIDFGREVVERIHRAGKKAMMFYCDHHVGTEPYGDRFVQMGLDALVGPCRAGGEMRKIADVPGRAKKEIRLYPYFFPLDLDNKPVFAPGGNPVFESQKYWVLVRRAMLRQPIDRIGYGGYLDLAVKYPDFLDHVAGLCNEFRLLHDQARQTPAWAAPFKVAVLNAWGKLRSWQNGEFGSGGLMEALSGLPVDVQFMSFAEIEASGVPHDVGVIINTGQAYTAWSGGNYWTNEKVVQAVRKFVADGGGFIGVGEPTACQHQGGFFQLPDVLGVQKEMGLSLTVAKPPAEIDKHFITADAAGIADLGQTASGIYKAGDQASILAADGQDVLVAANSFGRGRAVYLAGFKFGWNSPIWENVRLLERAICWSAGREELMQRWHCSNLLTECAAYAQTGRAVVVNNSRQPQETIVYDGQGRGRKVTLQPLESQWFDMAAF